MSNIILYIFGFIYLKWVLEFNEKKWEDKSFIFTHILPLLTLFIPLYGSKFYHVLFSLHVKNFL